MSEQLPESPTRIIRPHDGIDAFKDAFYSCVRDFPQARSLAWRMLLRDVRAMYRQSVFGYVWMVLPPLATTLIWVVLNNQKLVAIDSGDVPFPVFVLTGNILWAAFNGGVMGMLSMLQTARSMLSKVNFPHESLVMTALGKSALDGLVPAILLIPALPFYGIVFSPSMLLFPLGLLSILLLGGAIGLLFVPIAALFSDVGRGIQLALRLGYYVTPVIYPLPASGMMRSFLTLNPVTSVLVTSRSWLVGSGPLLIHEMFITLLFGLVIAIIGLLVFKVALPHIIERLNG